MFFRIELIAICLVLANSLIFNIPLGLARNQLIYLLVEKSLADEIEFCLERWQLDVRRQGFEITQILISDTATAVEIRRILQDAFFSEGLVGAFLIGDDIPFALYEDLEIDKETYPSDLFYMDLNGIWKDINGNGIYDNHTGDRSPEIFLGRLKVPKIVKEKEASLIQSYFERNHNFRIGNLSMPDQALIYIDDDWSRSSDTIDFAISRAYKNRTLVADNKTTTAEDYLNRLSCQNFSLVQLLAHGNRWWHDFYADNKWAGSVSSEEIWVGNHSVFFYNLFSCKNGNYTYFDYLAGAYLFSGKTLAVVAPADAGGMWYFWDFYEAFREKTIGESFLHWLTKRVRAEGGGWYDWSWYYGLTILGDPTLVKKPEIEEPETRKPDIAITGIEPYRNILSNQTSTSIEVEVQNQGNTKETFNVTLYVDEIGIGTRVLTLEPLEWINLIFQWNTTGISLGKHKITAIASEVFEEVETSDNTLTCFVRVSIKGDVSADGLVNIIDLSMIARAFNTYPGHPKWNSNVDINEDKVINIIDINLVATEYGKFV